MNKLLQALSVALMGVASAQASIWDVAENAARSVDNAAQSVKKTVDYTLNTSPKQQFEDAQKGVQGELKQEGSIAADAVSGTELQ